MPDATPKPARWYLPSRRWLRFSLRTFLIFVLMLSLALGWLGVKIERARGERELVTQIREIDGLVGHDAPARGAPPDLLLEWIGTAVGEHLPSERYTFVDISKQHASNAGRMLPDICRRMPDVTCLDAHDAGVVDADLRFLSRLAQLEFLRLDGNEIGDASARQLAALTQLTDLELGLTNLGDEGLLRLTALPKLQFLDVKGTYVSELAVRQFCAARPEVHLFWAPRLSASATSAARTLRKRGWWLALIPQDDRGAPLVGVSPPQGDEIPPLDERDLLRAFPRISGSANYYYDSKFAWCFVGLPQLESLEATSLNQAMLRKLGSSIRLRTLVAYGDTSDDSGWEVFRSLPLLEELTIYDAVLSSRNTEHLAAIKSLRRLTLCRPKSDDVENPAPTEVAAAVPQAIRVGLSRLSLLKHVVELNLALAELCDEDVEPLVGLSNLATLDITGTDISDAGLSELAGCKGLKELTCWGCKQLEPSGIARFRMLRPDVLLMAD